MARWHAEYAWRGGPAADADVLIDADRGRITSVVAGVARPGDAIALRGLVLPGLVNAHSHAFHRALRGRTHAVGGDFWSWRDLMYQVAGSLDPDRYRALATAVYAEMALAGITAVGEFHYLHHDPDGRPYGAPNAMGEALVDAAAAAGIRITLIDACYLRSGPDPRSSHPVRQRFDDGDVDRWAARVDELGDSLRGQGKARLGVAAHSVRAVGRDDLETVAMVGRRLECPVHAHVSEQPAENEACLAATGQTPTELLADTGFLGPTATAVHSTHVTPSDIGLLGSHRVTVCLCPTTERDLGDGIGPASKLAAAGAHLGVGSDSHAVIDLFEEARGIELNERLGTGRRGLHAPADLLSAATAGGNRALGWAATGLSAGGLVDFVSVSLTSARTARFEPSAAAAHAVFVATADDVDTVVVDGSTVVSAGEHVLVPEVARSLDSVLAELPGELA